MWHLRAKQTNHILLYFTSIMEQSSGLGELGEDFLKLEKAYLAI